MFALSSDDTLTFVHPTVLSIRFLLRIWRGKEGAERLFLIPCLVTVIHLPFGVLAMFTWGSVMLPRFGYPKRFSDTSVYSHK